MRKLIFFPIVLGAAPALAQQDMPTQMPVTPPSSYYGSATPAEEKKAGGLRIEGKIGMEEPNLNHRDYEYTYEATLGNSFAYGGEIGYDYPISDRFTLGPYFAADFGESNKCNTQVLKDATLGLIESELCFQSKSAISAGLRGGLVIGNSGELYLGVGYDKYNYSFDLKEKDAAGAPVTNLTMRSKDEGVGLSVGYNHNVSKALYLGLGMRVTEAGKFLDTEEDMERLFVHANIGFRF